MNGLRPPPQNTDSGGDVAAMVPAYKAWRGSNVFLLQGRFIFGPDVRSVFLTIFLIVAPVAVFCAFVARKLMDDFSHHLGILIMVVVVLFTIYDIILLLMTSGRDPGIILATEHHRTKILNTIEKTLFKPTHNHKYQTTKTFKPKPQDNHNTNLKTTTKTKDKVKGRLFLDVVIGQSPPILELLPSKNQPLLIWRNTFLILYLGLHIVDGVRALHLKGDRLPRKRLYEYLHPTTETEHQVES